LRASARVDEIVIWSPFVLNVPMADKQMFFNQ
jgi:hypothetical protein